MIKEEYVSFEVAKLLKNKGFPQEYNRYNSMVYNEKDYEDEYEIQRMVIETKLIKAGTLSNYPIGVPEPKCYCPTQQMALRWLREVHNIHINSCISYDTSEDADGNEVERWTFWFWEIFSADSGNLILCEEIEEYDSYEQACEAAIKYCLENLIEDTDHE